MSNEISKLKNKLKVIRPLLQKDKIKLDEMKLEMQKKLELLDQAEEKHSSVLSQKKLLIHSLNSDLSTDNEISVSSICNSRHYLNELDDALDKAETDMEMKSHAVDNLRDEILEHQLSIDKLEKYRDRKDQSLFVEVEKDNMHMMDELWTQKSAVEKNHE